MNQTRPLTTEPSSNEHSIMNCHPLRNLAACSLLGAFAVGGVCDATADEILIYKVSASRRWQQNEAYLPLSSAPQLRNANAGSFKDTSYLILNRSSGEATTVNYYTEVRDGGRYQEYAVIKDRFEVWGPNFPADALWEYQSVKATGNNAFTISLKLGTSANFSGDLNNDGQADAAKEGLVSFLVGVGGPRTFGKGVAAVTVPQVPARLAGVKREAQQTEFGPLESPQAFGAVYYRGAGAQTATLDVKLTTEALAVTAPANLTGVSGNLATDRFSSAGHGLETGDTVTFVTGTNFPELTVGTKYYVIRKTSAQFQLALTLADAKGGAFIDLSVAGSAGEFAQTATRGAVALVQAALERTGFDNVAPPTPLLP